MQHWQLPFLGLHEFPADLTAFEIQYFRVVQRAQIILASAQGETVPAIARQIGLSAFRVRAWSHCFNRHALAGLANAPRSGRPCRHDESARGTVIALTRIKPWSLGLLVALWTLARLQ